VRRAENWCRTWFPRGLCCGRDLVYYYRRAEVAKKMDGDDTEALQHDKNVVCHTRRSAMSGDVQGCLILRCGGGRIFGAILISGGITYVRIGTGLGDRRTSR